MAYTQCKPWMEEMLQVIAGNYEFAKAFIQERLPEIKVVPLEGTYLLWLDCTALGKTAEELEELMVQKGPALPGRGLHVRRRGQGL